MNKRRLVRATAAAFGAQAITVATSVLTVIFIARGLNVSEYGSWQFYLLVGSYGGLLHLGLCDGVYLRLGGSEYAALDRAGEGTEFRISSLVQAAVALIGIVIVLMAGGGDGRAFAVILALAYIPIFNCAAYLGCILQATDRTVEYSVSVVIDRLTFAAWTLLGMAWRQESFAFYAFGSILAKAVSLGYCAVITRDVVFSARASGQPQRAVKDIILGSRLMIANLSGQLVTGAARLAVIYRYGDAEFGRISLIMTLSNLFLQFVSQLGMVLFPALRRTDGASCRRVLDRLEGAVGIVLPLSFFAYIPLKIALSLFLPEYAEAGRYLILLLPVCFLYGKTQLIGTTYLKVCGRAGTLMALNVISAALSLALCFGAAYTEGGVWGVLMAVLISVALRSAMFDRVCHGDGDGWYVNTAYELLLCLIFSISAAVFTDVIAALVYAAGYGVYMLVKSGKIRFCTANNKA